MSIGQGKRVEQDPGDVAVFGPFRLLPAARLLERDGEPVEVGGRALDVLVALTNQAGKVVSKADLMSTIWADTTVVEGVLRTHVYNLRKALGDGVGGVRYVTSVAGRGYCFVAPVVRGASEATTPAAPNAWQLAHGLPPRLARMAGRDDAVRALSAQLAEHRFVTVVGAAGIGKTTVAVAVGHALLDDFGGAVRFIELGSLTDPALVAATVASTLGVPVQTDDALESLGAFLQDKRVLLVLDNCEHVADAAASLGEHLFSRAPRVHLLTTSREALRVEGEHAHRLGPLEMPTEVLGMDADTVQTFPSVQVLLERAAASGWSGDLTDDDVPIVAETCRRLDGVPLAIELAASFVGQCGLQGMAAVLDDRLRLLWLRGRRTAPPRQQTLHALIAWSYDRLLERERMVLRRLSVFVGTFPFDAAKAVVLEGGDSDESLLEVVNELVAKSLLSASVEDSAVVYRLLETTRVYALERLAERGEVERTSIRHALLFAERLEHSTEVRGPEPLCRNAADLGNVRAALLWSLSSPPGHSAGVRLAAVAARMLLDRGLVTECHDVCRQALDVLGPGETGTLVEIALRDGLAVSVMYSTRGMGADVRLNLVRGLELARALGGGDREIRLLGLLNGFLIRIGEWGEALEVAKQGMAATRLAESAGTLRAHWMLALSHHCCGNHALAQEHCEEGLQLAATSREEPMMHFRLPQVLLTLARTLWLRGQPHRALAMARQVMDDTSSLGHPVDKCVALLLCEPLYVWCGEWPDSGRLLDMMDEHVERYSLTSHRGVAMALRGELLVKTGRPQEGCDLLRTAHSLLKAVGNASHDTYVASALAEGLAATGSLDEALGAIEGAIDEAKRRGGTWDLPELLRLKGGFLAARSPADARAVDRTLSAAIELARRQGALAWELRAATALARERLRRGGGTDSLQELAAVYARFTDDTETPDLQAARSLLDGALTTQTRGATRGAGLVKRRQAP
jgi:predicted ATPase/DNA-binding winged helix-turn-helix (wHTH) protein